MINLPASERGAAKTCKSLLGNTLTPHPKGPDPHATLETSQIMTLSRKRLQPEAFTSVTSNCSRAQREKGACGNQPLTLQPCTSPVPPQCLNLQSSLSLVDPSHLGKLSRSFVQMYLGVSLLTDPTTWKPTVSTAFQAPPLETILLALWSAGLHLASADDFCCLSLKPL